MSKTSATRRGVLATSVAAGAASQLPAHATAAVDETNTGAAIRPFRVNIGRKDGEQEIKGVDVTLPKGLVGKLAGIPYCSEATLTAAAAASGASEQANASCPASEIGTTSTEAGTATPGPAKNRSRSVGYSVRTSPDSSNATS